MTIPSDASADLAALGIPRRGARAITDVVRTAVTGTVCELLPGVEDRPEASQWLVAAALTLTQMAPVAARMARPELSDGHANAAALPGILIHVAAVELINRYRSAHGELPAAGAGGGPPVPSPVLVAARDAAVSADAGGAGDAHDRLRGYADVVADAMRRVLPDAASAEGGWVLLAVSTAIARHQDALPEPGRPRRRRARDEAGAAAAGFAYRYGLAVLTATALSLLGGPVPDGPGSPGGDPPAPAGVRGPNPADAGGAADSPEIGDPTEIGGPTEIGNFTEAGNPAEAGNAAPVRDALREPLDWLAAARFDETIAEAVRRTRRVDPTVEAAARAARAVSPAHEDPSGAPVSVVPLDLAGKLAQQGAVAHALGLDELAVDCARRATYWYRSLDAVVPAGSRSAGYLAYSALIVAQAALDDGDVAGAHRAAAECMARFQQQTGLLTPVNWPDVIHALTVQSECQVLLDEILPARQSLADALYLGSELHRQAGGPIGPPGGMPPAWGLPVVPTAKQWRRLSQRIGALVKRLP